MMEVKFWRDVIGKSPDLLAALKAGRLNSSYLETNIDGLPPGFTPKPLHGFFIALFSLAAGIHEEWVGCLWSAILGTLTIALAGLWAARHFGKEAGILSAMFLAVSHSHVMYSRSQLAEADAIFFTAFAVFLHVNLSLKSRRGSPVESVEPRAFWRAATIGVLYGMAVGVNYRCLLILPIVFLWDLFASNRNIQRLGGLGLGMTAVMGMLELPYRIYIWRGGTLPGGMMTYFEGFWARLFKDVPVGEKTAAALFHPHGGMFLAYADLDMLLWVGGMALGLWATFRNACPVRRLVCVLAWVPITLFSLVTRGDGPRAVMTSIPFFAILAALGFLHFRQWCFDYFAKSSSHLGKYALLFRILFAVLILGAGGLSLQETRVRSAWPDVGRWLAQEPRQVVTTTYPLAVRYYLRKDLAKLPPPEDTATVAPGIWVIDRYNATYAYPFPVVRKLISSHKPERIFEGRVYPWTGLFFDWSFFMRSPNWRAELKRPDMGQIEIYKIP